MCLQASYSLPTYLSLSLSLSLSFSLSLVLSLSLSADPWCIFDSVVVVSSVFLLFLGTGGNTWVKQVYIPCDDLPVAG